MPDEAAAHLHGGNIYLSAEAYEKYLPGLDSVALLQRDGDIVLLPVHQAGAGGSMIKVRNARGDRVIPAREYLAGCEIPEDVRLSRACRWDSALAALRLVDPHPHP